MELTDIRYSPTYMEVEMDVILVNLDNPKESECMISVDIVF